MKQKLFSVCEGTTAMTQSKPRTLTSRRVVTAAFSFLLALGCSDGAESGAVGATVSQPLLYNTSRTLWTSALNRVPVCWANPGFASEKLIIKNAVQQTWAKHADLSFDGWGACPTTGTTPMIRLETIATGAGADASADVGMEALRAPGSGGSARFFLPATPSTSRLEYLAVHEFGHILGFSHEQDSPDNWNSSTNQPINCHQTGAPSRDGVQVSAYDQNSIMNYCGSHGNNSGTLSDGDKKAIQQVYGPESPANVSAIRAGTGDLHVFIRGSSGALEWRSPSGSWTSLGGVIVGTPAAVSWSGGSRVDVFVRGTDQKLYTQTLANGSWSGFASLGGSFTDNVAAVSWGPGRIDLFGQDSNGMLVGKSFSNGVWTAAWQNMGGPFVGAVASISRAPNTIDLFVRGTNGAFYRKSWNGSSWIPSITGWEPLGGNFLGAPAVVASNQGMELFGRGTDGKVYNKAWNVSTNAWLPSSPKVWNSLGGPVTGVPAAVKSRDGTIRLFARGTNLRLYMRPLSAGVWAPWQDLGGTLLSSPRAETQGDAIWARGSDEAVHVWSTYWNSVGNKMSW